MDPAKWLFETQEESFVLCRMVYLETSLVQELLPVLKTAKQCINMHRNASFLQSIGVRKVGLKL